MSRRKQAPPAALVSMLADVSVTQCVDVITMKYCIFCCFPSVFNYDSVVLL